MLINCYNCFVLYLHVVFVDWILLQLKPVRSLESFKQSSDNWWSHLSHSPPVPQLRLKPPIMSPAPVSPPISNNGYDLFGSTPFVVGGGGSVDGDSVFVVASPSSVDLVRLPPPTQLPSSKVMLLHVCLLSYIRYMYCIVDHCSFLIIW